MDGIGLRLYDDAPRKLGNLKTDKQTNLRQTISMTFTEQTFVLRSICSRADKEGWLFKIYDCFSGGDTFAAS